MPENFEWCFRALEVEPSASADEIKKSYRELVKVWHPDRFQGDANLQAKAQERLKRINVAFETLQELLRGNSSSPRTDARHATGSNDTPKTPEEFFALGIQCLENGKDVKAGAKWVQRSAELGLAKAQALLGHLFFRGDGVPKSKEQAVTWWIRAAEKGHAESQYCLGCLFAEDHGAGLLEKSVGNAIGWKIGDAKIEAYKWFNLAVTNGHAKARGGMEQMSTSMTQKQINEARTHAARFYPQYPVRSAREIIEEWIELYMNEISKNPRFEKWYLQVATDFLTFKGLQEELIECLVSRLQSHFLNNHTAATSDYFKDVGAGWKGIFGGKQNKTDRSRAIAAKMMLDGWDVFSPKYICQKESILNQLWLRLYAAR